MLTLRPYQQAAIASIYGYFEKESGNPLVVIPRRRIGREKSTRPVRSTGQTGIVPPG